MAMKHYPLIWGLLLLIIINSSLSQEDSLRSALNAVNRRQRDLENSRYDEYNGGDYGYFHDSPDDLAFLPEYNNRGGGGIGGEDSPYLDSIHNRANEIQKRTSLEYKRGESTSFRERFLEEDRERQLEELARNYLADLDPNEYNELVRELWEKYSKNYPSITYNRPTAYMANSDLRKKSNYYPHLGLDSAGLRKRGQYDDNNDYYNNYFMRTGDGYDADSGNWIQSQPLAQRDRKYDSYYGNKRFPVTKRSSTYTETKEKRSDSKKKVLQTDPKVAKDLNNIFGMAPANSNNNDNDDENKDNKKKNKKDSASFITTASEPAASPAPSPPPPSKPNPNNTKEEIIEGTLNDKPLQLKKKSINWSDYFGLDRRKKSAADSGLDNEWLMERYHKSIRLNNKRNADYPLQSFKNHDAPEKKVPAPKKEEFDEEDSKITELDTKLKNMEDELIDDALKFTGAHEGTTDTKEIQEVKDRVISRLAAAYNLEKMRRALGEYKLSVAKERERLKLQQQQQQQMQKNFEVDDYDINEEKRVSVARKHAIDEDREKTPESDNNIKCAQGDENCDELNYRTPSDVLQQTGFVACPRVQQACADAASGKYSQAFEVACAMHQMCHICSNNSWFAPTRQCNVLFLSKAFEMCAGKPDCQKEARRSIRTLVDVNQSLRLEPLGDCELACPDRR